MTDKIVGQQKVKEYRERMDRTLASKVLVDKDSVRALVKDQLIRSSPSDTHDYIDNFIEKRSVEVSNFLDMLRSVSSNDSTSKTQEKPHGDWKEGTQLTDSTVVIAPPSSLDHHTAACIRWLLDDQRDSVMLYENDEYVGLVAFVKQDNEDYRVMYREGPQGTPFHTLLVEGYVDGPLDNCLCLAWEAALYWKWWPQFTIPPFKIITSKCVQKIRIGEQICLVRMKVTWPLSTREAVVHYFVLEYFEEDLIIVLLNSVSDSESIDKITHGFSSDGIPEAGDIVRIDLVGGCALQRVTSNRSYFRTIATMDMKLDFVPPSLINFVSRQLIGSGFKLYKKTVASIAQGDEDFGKALKDPIYARIREGLNHENKIKKVCEQEEAVESDKPIVIHQEELKSEILQADSPVTDSSLSNHSAVGIPEASTLVIGQMLPSEIEEEEVERETQSSAVGSLKASAQVTGEMLVGGIVEEEIKGQTQLNENGKAEDCIYTDVNSGKCQVNRDKKVYISSEVEHALNILNDAISAIQSGGLIFQACQEVFSSKQEEVLHLKRVAKEAGSSSSEESSNYLSAPIVKNMDKTLDEAEKGSCSPDIRHEIQESSPSREVNYKQILPASPTKKVNDLQKSSASTLSSSQNGTIAEVNNNKGKDLREAVLKVNGFHESIAEGEEKSVKKKKQRHCCFFPGHM